MNRKLKCQLITILLDKDNEFSKKYTSVLTSDIDYDYLMEEYFENKNMRLIKVDHQNQSICFTSQKSPVSFFNQSTHKNEMLYEEVHIHCNDLYHFDRFVNYLIEDGYMSVIDETDKIPHHDVIKKGDINKYELIMAPMTNEVSATKNLLNILSQRSDETIFRALAIHFGKLLNHASEINIDLIHQLDEIYQSNIVNNKDSIFSSEIGRKLLNIYNTENNHEEKIQKSFTENILLQNSDYIISFEDSDDVGYE